MTAQAERPQTLWHLAQDAMNAAEDTGEALALDGLADREPSDVVRDARRAYYRLRDELLRACVRVDDGRDWKDASA